MRGQTAIDQRETNLNVSIRSGFPRTTVGGREFAAAAVSEAVGQTEEAVETACDALARTGIFLNPCGRTSWPDGTVSARYKFVHDLYREAFYGRIPPRRRARLHVQIAARLERGYGVLARELSAELAAHFVEGNDLPRAVVYLRYAAEQALARNAHREAVELLERALHLAGCLPDSTERAQHELTIQATLAPALMGIQGWGSLNAQRAYQRAKEISAQLRDPSCHAAVLVGLATLFEARADYRQSQALLEEYLGQAPDNRPESLLVESHTLLACSLFHQGAFDQSVEHAKRAVSLYRRGGSYPLLAAFGADPAIGAGDWAALSLWFLGYADRALAKAEELLRLARDHAFTLALAQSQAAVIHVFRREPALAGELAGAAIDVASRNGFPYWEAAGRIVHGWARTMQAGTADGIADIQRGLDGCRASGVEMDRPFHLALLAEAYVRAGKPNNAVTALDEAFAIVRESRAFFYEAELYRLRGDVLKEAGSLDDVHTSLQRALEVSRLYGTRSLELRAAVSLARFWQDCGKGEQARELLADVYSGFTEGYETADLAEARELLDNLASTQAGWATSSS